MYQASDPKFLGDYLSKYVYYYIPPVLFHTFLGIWKYIHLLKCNLFFHLSYPCQLEESTKLFMVAWKSHLLAKKFIWLTFCDHFEEVRLSVLPNGKGCLCIVLRQAIKIVMGSRFRSLWKCQVQTLMGLRFLYYKSSKKLSPHKMLSSSLPDLSLVKISTC